MSTNKSIEFFQMEYVQLKLEQSQRIGFRDNMIFVQLAAVGGIASWSITNLDTSHAVYAFLIIPWVCFVLGWTYIANDIKISHIGAYFRERLAKNLAEAHAVEGDPADEAILMWESSHTADRFHFFRKLAQWLVDILTFVAPGFLSVAAYVFLSLPESASDRITVIVCFELALLGLLLVFFTVNSRFKSPKETPNSK